MGTEYPDLRSGNQAGQRHWTLYFLSMFTCCWSNAFTWLLLYFIHRKSGAQKRYGWQFLKRFWFSEAPTLDMILSTLMNSWSAATGSFVHLWEAEMGGGRKETAWLDCTTPLAAFLLKRNKPHRHQPEMPLITPRFQWTYMSEPGWQWLSGLVLGFFTNNVISLSLLS